jgi:hypothetical protein
MRRLFVIWLILLFPLNVLAMSMSVAAFEHVRHDQHGQQHVEPAASVADSLFSQLFDTQSGADLDADEPPAVADLHDQVNEEDQLQLVLQPGRSIAASAPLRHAQSAFPPLKPPPTL